MRQAARAAVTLLKADANVFPIENAEKRRVGLVEFASNYESAVLDKGEISSLQKRLKARFPRLKTVALHTRWHSEEVVAQAFDLALESEVLIIATRSAHLVDEQTALVQQLIGAAGQVIVLCLRNPYDAAAFREAGTILCTYSDTPPSLNAAVGALAGDFKPQGKLPIALEV